MRVLVLGGTRFLGRHVAEAALARGDAVTLFTRGRTNPGLLTEAEHLHGDRDGDLRALEGREWDVVVDTSGYVPRIVRASAELLAPAAGRYVFVSSMSVYADQSVPGTAEDGALAEPSSPDSEDVAADYGGLKAACERVVQAAFGPRALIVRPGLIVGPHDPTGRFTWWVARLARGGDVLAPEPRDQRVQLIDGRDLAAWMLDLASRGGAGVYNANGPAGVLTMEEMLREIIGAVGGDARLIWVPERVLHDAGVGIWMDLPLWIAPGIDPEHRGFLSHDVSRALAAGLRPRPLGDTARDTLAWLRTAPPLGPGAPTEPPPGLAPERERAILASL